MSEPMVYANLLNEIKRQVRAAQTRAIAAVNSELIDLYWAVGRTIAEQQQQQGWGAGVIPRLARDLHNELPEIKGFSERNLKLMVQFYREYPQPWFPPPIGQPPVAQLVDTPAEATGRSLFARTPWAHHIQLMQRIKDHRLRAWYAAAAQEHGWSRNILQMQIQTSAHARIGRSANNFALRLPPPQSDLVRQALKDPYLFDFLTLEEPFHERELECGLIQHLERFLLELGRGFAFVGRQYRLTVGEDEFYIDLLFYHLKLRCYVVIELKRGKFKPEYAGKLNFYCNVVDDHLRHPTDQPTIGLILCQSKNKVLAEYALRGIDKPIGVAEYELTRALPDSLQSTLPSIEQIEQELQADIGGDGGDE